MICFAGSALVADVPFPAMTNAEPSHQAVVWRALKASSYYAITLLDCQVVDGVIVLVGTVPSYHLKQAAQATVDRLGLAERIENRVEVRSP